MANYQYTAITPGTSYPTIGSSKVGGRWGGTLYGLKEVQKLFHNYELNIPQLVDYGCQASARMIIASIRTIMLEEIEAYKTGEYKWGNWRYQKGSKEADYIALAYDLYKKFKVISDKNGPENMVMVLNTSDHALFIDQGTEMRTITPVEVLKLRWGNQDGKAVFAGSVTHKAIQGVHFMQKGLDACYPDILALWWGITKQLVELGSDAKFSAMAPIPALANYTPAGDFDDYYED